MTLFDYQQKIHDAVLASPATRPLIVIPTGGGKTRTCVEIARSYSAPLWLAHRKELVDQAQGTAADLGVSLRCMTVQGLLASGTWPETDCLFADESHHLLADEWSTIADHYPRIVGMTATPERADGSGLGAIFNHLVVGPSVKELVAYGRLVPCSVIGPNKLLRAGQVAQHPLTAYRKHASGRKAVLFAPNVPAAMQYAVEFTAAGVKAAYVYSGINTATRERVFADYAAGRYQVLCNVAIATEGFDDPATSCVIIARGCGTPGLYVQMVGRGLRVAPGKANCIVLDLRGVSNVHGDPMEDRVYSLEGRGIRRKAETVDQRYCAVCGCCWAGTPCTECGNVIEPAAPPKVMNVKIAPKVYLPKATDEEKTKRLAALMGEGRRKGWKPGAAYVRYKVLFGGSPTAAMISEARRLTFRQSGE